MIILRDWLKDFYGESIPTTAQIEELFTFHALEVEEVREEAGHEVIDMKVLPDRASDCLSHRGIARELATLTGTLLAHDPLTTPVALLPVSSKLAITIENSTNCRRFALAQVTGVTVGESPEWLVSRLRALGQRSINNVVDATNYVMLSLGQPLHAYDAAKLTEKDGVRHFAVQMAKEGKEITTLTGDTYTLSPSVQLIVDAYGAAPLGIAGIKGGKRAEIDDATTDIILEAANFDPQLTRKASQFLKLQTDASKRFENNISPELVSFGLASVVALILDIAGGSVEGYADSYPTKRVNERVTVPHEKVNAILGLTLTESEVEDILKRLGFVYTKTGGVWEVMAPFERTDITIPEDVIAEIGRVYGYRHLASVLPEKRGVGEYNARHYYSEKIRSVLVAQRYSEVITSSFCKKDTVELFNALASDKKCLRSSLVNNLTEVLDRNMPNVDLLGVNHVAVFEIGTVFAKNADGSDVIEHVALALGVRTKQQGYVPKDDAMLQETVAVLEEILGMSLSGTIKKGVYECNLTNALALLPVPTSYEAFVPKEDVTFKSYSPYPFVSRDIALWVPEDVSASDVEAILREEGGELLVRVTLFDEFKKDGRISFAFRLVFQSYEKTLTDVEVGERMQKITGTLLSAQYEVR